MRAGELWGTTLVLDSGTMTVIPRMTGAHHAEGELIGELRYVAQKLIGRGH